MAIPLIYSSGPVGLLGPKMSKFMTIVLHEIDQPHTYALNAAFHAAVFQECSLYQQLMHSELCRAKIVDVVANWGGSISKPSHVVSCNCSATHIQDVSQVTGILLVPATLHRFFLDFGWKHTAQHQQGAAIALVDARLRFPVALANLSVYKLPAHHAAELLYMIYRI